MALFNYRENFRLSREKVENTKKSKTTDFLLRGDVYLMTFCGVIPPVVNVLDSILNPCLTSYFGYMISRQCSDATPDYYITPTSSSLETLEKVIITLITHVTWSSLFPGGLFQMSSEYVVQGHCFLVNIEKFGK